MPGMVKFCERYGVHFTREEEKVTLELPFKKFEKLKEDTEKIEAAKTICKEEIEMLKGDYYGAAAVSHFEKVLRVLEGKK